MVNARIRPSSVERSKHYGSVLNYRLKQYGRVFNMRSEHYSSASNIRLKHYSSVVNVRLKNHSGQVNIVICIFLNNNAIRITVASSFVELRVMLTFHFMSN